MSRVVFCRLIESFGDCATYHYGPYPDSMTGIAIFYNDDRRFEITCEHTDVSFNALGRVWNKYRDSLTNNVFPERMAIQIG